MKITILPNIAEELMSLHHEIYAVHIALHNSYSIDEKQYWIEEYTRLVNKKEQIVKAQIYEYVAPETINKMTNHPLHFNYHNDTITILLEDEISPTSISDSSD